MYSDGTVVGRHHEIGVGNARRHPRGEKIAERGKRHNRRHRVVVRVAFVAPIEQPVVWRRGKVRGVWVHMAEQNEPGLAGVDQAVQLGLGDVVQPLGLSQRRLVQVAPRLVVEIALEPSEAALPVKPTQVVS